MRATVTTSVSPRPVDEDSVVAWANGEVQKILEQARAALNARGTERLATTTSDATVTTIWSQQMRPDRIWHVEYLVLAYDAASGNCARYHETKAIKRASAAPSVVATTTIEPAYEDVAGWDVTYAAASDGTNTLSVTGAAATTVFWVAFVQVFESPLGGA